MKNIVITPLASVALGAAALALAGATAAFPNGGTAADVVSGLKDDGYNVQVNGIVAVPLATCRVLDVHPPHSPTVPRSRKSSTPWSSSMCHAPRTTETSAATGPGC